MAGCGSKPQQDILPAGSTVVALSDSLTHSYGANPDTSADVLTRANEITEQNPDLVLLGVGGNDVLQRISPDTTRANIIATIDTLQANNIDVVLIAEPYFSTSALFGKVSDNPLYEDIVETEAIPLSLYSDGWSTVLSDEALKSDKIHANAAGYRRFAEGLHDYLKDEGWVR